MQKEVDERENTVDSKLAEMEAAQRQIGEQVAELRGVVESNYKKSAEDTNQAIDRVRDEILGALVDDTAGLIAALASNENVWVGTDESRYLLFIY